MSVTAAASLLSRHSQLASRVLREPGTSALHFHAASTLFCTQSQDQLRSRTKQQLLATRLRSFYTSASAGLPHLTESLRHPRWINTRKNGEEEDAERSDESEEAVGSESENNLEDGARKPEEDGRLKSESAGDGTGNGAPSGSASPPEPPNSPGGASDSQSGQSSPPPNGSSDSGSRSNSGSGSGSSTQISRQSVPENYPQVLALPIARRPLFPGFYKAVVVRNPGVVAAIKDMMRRGQPYLGAFLLKDENTDSDVISDMDSVHPVGVFAQITSVFAAAGKDDKDEGLTAVLYPHRRIRLTELVKSGQESSSTGSVVNVEEGVDGLPTPPMTPISAEHEQSTEVARQNAGSVQTAFLHNHDISLVNIENLTTQPYNKDDQNIRAFMSEIVSVFKDIAQLNPLFRDQITNFSINQVATNVFDEPDKLADFAAAVSTGEVGELQDVLESLSVEDRLGKALLVLKKELINAQLQSKLSRDVDSKIAKRQREYYLMEQLKGIKKELGMESDGKDKLIEKFKERANALKMPDGVRKVFDEELNKLTLLEPAASEANVTRNYLEWLTQVSSVANLAILGLSKFVLDSLGRPLERKLLYKACCDCPG
jgi:ATP-dependent Lon protease